MDPVALQYIRGDTVESVHRAHLAVVDATGRKAAAYGNAGLVTFLRSAAKPMQLVPLVESGAAERFGFSEKELAIMAGSHSGEPAHVKAVEGILKRIGLGPEALQCGRHAPFDATAAERVGPAYTALHHNCSGKHSGMLALCKDQGWDVASYLEPRHPLQRSIRAVVAQECGARQGEVATAIDGCGVVTYAVPVARGARAFARLADPEDVDGKRGTALRQIRDAMMRHPDMVAGTARLDTDLMRARPGEILVKSGAEASYGIGLPKRGLGIIVKIEDGNPRGMGLLLVRLLEHLDVLAPRELKALETHWKEPIRNVAGRAVGRVECTLKLGPAKPRPIEAKAR